MQVTPGEWYSMQMEVLHYIDADIRNSFRRTYLFVDRQPVADCDPLEAGGTSKLARALACKSRMS